MSSNRSVQAAQRRRAGTTEPQRGPNQSINSAQVFNKQQQQPQQNQYNDLSKGKKEGLSSVNKMTIPQAITLITLRLGALESKMMNGLEPNIMMSNVDGSSINTEIIQTILSRLDSLENQPQIQQGSQSSTELTMLKQQFETVKQATIQMKNSVVTLVKENANLKTQIEILRKDLNEKGDLLVSLQNMTMDNNQKILELSLNQDQDIRDDNHVTNIDFNIEENELETENVNNEILGMDLKALIENELRCN